jgi:hypothetical protein
MTEVVIWKLLDMAFNVASVAMEREAVIAKVKALEETGASPEAILTELTRMRDEAIAGAQDAIDQAP